MKRIALLIFLLGIAGLLSACNGAEASPEAGQNLSVTKGCAACHAVDHTPETGLSPKIGPSWAGLYESPVELSDGSSVTADETYLIESIQDPNAKIVSGYTRGAMPEIPLTDEELVAIVAYIKSVEDSR